MMQAETLEVLQNLCLSRVNEGLHLEFKEKEDFTTPELTKGDKKYIAQSISAFANSDGGTLIYGIRSERCGGSDVATALIPIQNVDRFLANVRLVCGLNISPELSEISTTAIYSDKGDGSGFVVCSVGRSNRRPHMSTAPGVHSYYRRSFEGSVPMTPSEVRDQILAVRDAILTPVIKPAAGGSFSNSGSWISGRSTIRFGLKNAGGALCRNPFLRVSAGCELHSNSNTYDAALSAWKTTFPYGTLIHVEDQQHCLALSVDAYIRFDILKSAFSHGSSELTEAVLVLPGSSEYRASTISDKVSLNKIELTLTYGAENSPLVSTEVSISRKELAQRILEDPTVQSMAANSLGFYRADLVHEFLSL